MSRYYHQRPENALKKASEFIEVGKPSRALDTLYDVIKGRRHRSFSEKVIEPIMLKYLELCVELKKPQRAKEGLYQYRLMCQSVNVGLLEKVIRSYIRMAEDKTEAAKALFEKNSAAAELSGEEPISIVEIDDLDNLSMADMTLLNVITEEEAQEQSGRSALIPWVKFLWESYTQCLDLLRNNPRLEVLYHDIAQMAYKFCLTYGRKTEFRKLCERLRKHFDDIINRPSQFQGSQQFFVIDFSSPETQQLSMETRLSQLDSAITLELWTEAYKAIEDIHLLLVNQASKKCQTRLMAYYYQKLSLVFWKAGNLLFHAATLMKYYLLCKDMKKNVSSDELERAASQVLLATLAIPFPSSHPEFERFVERDKGMMDKSQRLATLLFLPQPPTRASMIRDLSRHGILGNSAKPLQDLYDILETRFSPLSLCSDVDQLLKTAAAEGGGGEGDHHDDHPIDYLEQYADPLRQVTLVRLIKQVSQVYATIDYDHLLKMTIFSNQSQLDRILVELVRTNDMQISVDHRSKCIKFGSSLASEASREDLADEGPQLQIMPSETVRYQLVNVMECLDEAVDMITATSPALLSNQEDSMIRKRILSQLRATSEVETHRALVARQKLIASRRQQLEQSAVDKETEEKMRAEQVLKQAMMMEAKRLETQRQDRERKKVEAEQLELKARRVQERIKQIGGGSGGGGQTPIGLTIIEQCQAQGGEEASAKLEDLETALQRQQEELQKGAKDHLARMKAQEKRLDHVERAKRVEEMSLIGQENANKKEREKGEWEASETGRIAHLTEERKIAIANRDRMKRMREAKDKFLKGVLDARREHFIDKLSEFEKSFQAEKAKRLAERKDQRKAERRRQHEEEKAAMERARIEAVRKEKEEEDRIARERIEKELEERNRVTFEKQQAKQREIQERERENLMMEKLRKEATVATPPPPATAAVASAAGGGGAPGGDDVWRSKSAGEKAVSSSSSGAPANARPTAAAPAAATPATNVWVPRAIREKKAAAAMAGGLPPPPPQDAMPPRERPERQERERPERGEREPGFDRRDQLRERPKTDRRGVDYGDRDRDGEQRKRSDRGGDWGRGGSGGDRRDGGDRGFGRPKERERGFERDRDRRDQRGGGGGGGRPSQQESVRAPDDGPWRRGEAPSAGRDRGERGDRVDRAGDRGERGDDDRGGSRGGKDGGGGGRDDAGGNDGSWRRPMKKEEASKPPLPK